MVRNKYSLMTKEHKDIWNKIVLCASESPQHVLGLSIPIDIIFSVNNEIKTLQHNIKQLEKKNANKDKTE